MSLLEPLPLAAAWAAGTALAAGALAWNRIGGTGVRALIAIVTAVAVGTVAVTSPSRWPVWGALVGLVVIAFTLRRPRASVIGWGLVVVTIGPLAVGSGIAGAGDMLLLGCISVGLCLGHWFLVDPHLPRQPMRMLAIGSLAGLVVSGVTTLMSPQADPLFGPATFAVAIAAGTITGLVLVGVLGALAVPTYKGVQSATGLFYVATMSVSGYVILASTLRLS